MNAKLRPARNAGSSLTAPAASSGGAGRAGRSWTPWLLLLLCCMALLSASGRVYRRWRGGAEHRRAIETLGGTLAYEADVSVNNGSGRLALFSVNRPLPPLFRELRRAMRPAVYAYADGGMGQAIVEQGRETTRIIGVHLPEHRQSLLFAITTEDELQRAPDRHRLAAIPEYPGSEPLFFAMDRQGGLGVAIATAQAGRREVMAYYRTQLSQAGWTQLFPPASGHRERSESALAIFEKGPHMAGVHIEPSQTHPGQARITVLHKQPGIR